MLIQYKQCTKEVSYFLITTCMSGLIIFTRACKREVCNHYDLSLALSLIRTSRFCSLLT